MDKGNFALFHLGIGLLLLLGATIASLFLLSRHWRRKAVENLRRQRSRLRQLHLQHKEIACALQAHSQEDPEPYGSRVASLHSQLGQIQAQMDDLERQHVALQERAHHFTRDGWRKWITSPRFWSTLLHESLQLDEGLSLADKSLAGAMAAQQALERLGWEVAGQIRQVRELQERLAQLLDQLRLSNLRGKTLEAALQQEKHIRTSLSRLPSYFYDGNERMVLEQAGKKNIASVYQFVEQHRPILLKLLRQAGSWQKGCTRASEQVKLLERALANLEQTLASAPPELDLEAYKAQLEQLRTIYPNLHATLARLEVENLELVAQEAVRLTQIAQESENQILQARQQLPQLRELLEELSSGLKQLSMQFAMLGTKTIRPITWGQSLAVLTDLNRQANQLGTVQQTRQPEQVTETFDQAVQLNLRRKELEQHYQKIEQLHAQLTGLLTYPELQRIEEWLQEAYRLTELTKQYAAENWSRLDAVDQLPDDLEAIAGALQYLLPTNQSQPIPEEELHAHLEDMQRLTAALQKLRQRVENIRLRLVEIQDQEKLSREQLLSAQATLNQATYIARSNAYLSQIASQEMERLQKNLQSLLGELAQRQQGSVKEKSRQTAELIARIEQFANRTLDRLSQEMVTQMGKLSAALTKLENIAPLEEASVLEAQRLLSSGKLFSADKQVGKARSSLDEWLPELKRRSDFWHSCVAALRALEEMKQHVLRSYEEASANRNKALAQMAEVSNWLRQTRTWPPTSVTLEVEQQELKNLDAQWQSIKGSPTKALALVAQLGKLSAKYQTLGERISQSAERLTQEQRQVEEVEASLSELAQLWQNQWQAHRDNPTASQEIRSLLEALDREHAQIRRQYQQGNKNFDQVLQALRGLQRKVRLFQVALDDDHAMDIGGRVSTRR